MNRQNAFKSLIRMFRAGSGFFFFLTATLVAATEEKVDFNRDIRPIISDNCFACHGPDAKSVKGGLRLDLRDTATKPLKSGATAIVPSQPDQSEMLRRIQTKDADDLMPPPESGKKLTSAQINTLKRWISEGAEYSKLWAFVPPKHPQLPEVKNKKWPRNGIDFFVLERLEKEHLKPADEADKTSLIRRLTLDLTGLPPTPAEVEAFLNDKSPDAYETVVDRLLSSPRYGERMTLEWLDAARYADTHGYHIDSARDMTRWRDWVIKSYNNNEPFDQFTVEQLAGDLLPNATVDQKIASGFNRNHMVNFEGGAIPEEYATAYILDRVNTTATVWLGLTLACAQCHDHKYDPLTAKDYYSMYAFFNNVPEKGLDGSGGNAVPVLQFPTPEQKVKLDDFKARIEETKQKRQAYSDHRSERQARWEKDFAASQTEPATPSWRFSLDESLDGNSATGSAIKGTWQNTNELQWCEGATGKALVFQGDTNDCVSTGITTSPDQNSAFSYGCWINRLGDEGAVIAKIDENEKLRGFDLLVSGSKVFVHLINSWPDNAIRVHTKIELPKETWTHVMVTYDGSSKAAGVKVYFDGQAVQLEVKEDKLTDSIANNTPLNLGRRSKSYPFKGSLDDVRFYDRALSGDEILEIFDSPLRSLVQIPAAERSDDQKKKVDEHFRHREAQTWNGFETALSQLRKELDEFGKNIPTTMVMAEMENPRETHILVRGQYDKKGDTVLPATPASLPPMPADSPRNRLGLAQWLVSPKQPLTARVTVNRFWQMYFGIGLVKTAENFGSQGDWPTHPELLDWLASEFMLSGWDTKAMQKLIVMSATYRQSSVASKRLISHDPENQLLARGARFRLQAEFIRDQALAVSGLLNNEIGGQPVNPYQPPGLWEELMVRADGDRFTAQKYVQDHGNALYRRSMYIFWKRTSPPASMATLDAPDRQTCVVRRQRTNTPLQALVLMNDPTYMEAARKLAERLMKEAATDRDRVALAYKLTLARKPKYSESSTLLKLYRSELETYRKAPKEAELLLTAGESSRDEQLDPAELAAWTIVATTILNLDETLSKG